MVAHRELRVGIVGCVVGERFGWEGVDVFHFDAAGRIKALFTYATCPRRPNLRKELGVPLSSSLECDSEADGIGWA